jgi:hypothetical protein
MTPILHSKHFSEIVIILAMAKHFRGHAQSMSKSRGVVENQDKLGHRGRVFLSIWTSEFKKKPQKQISFGYFEPHLPIMKLDEFNHVMK